MPLSVVCPNGHRIAAQESLAGKTVRCPKCKAAIEIPPLDEPDTLDEFEGLEEWDPLSDGGEGATDFDPLSTDTLADPLSDPLADLSSLELSGFDQAGLAVPQSAQPLAGSPYSAQPTPNPAPVQSPARAPTPARVASSSAAAIWMAAGSGLLVGVLFTALVGWMLLAGRGGSDVAAAIQAASDRETTSVTAEPLVNTEPVQPQAVEPTVAASVPGTEPPATNPQPAAVSADPTGLSFVALQPAVTPLDLTQVESDKRLEVYKLPGKTWAADYDRVSGRLAVTNDDVGIVVYDIDETAGGRAGPVGAFQTDGLPSAVCFKPTAERRFLVAAGNKRAKAELFDADSLEKLGEASAPDAKFLDYLGGNPNLSDPFVYYSTQRADQDDSRRFKADRLGRINVNSMEAETVPIYKGNTEAEVTAILFSDIGDVLYLRDRAGGTTCVGFVTKPDGTQGSVILGGSGQTASCAIGPHDQIVAAGYGLMNQYFSTRLGFVEFDIEAIFPQRPRMAGFNESSLVIGSTNDCRALATIPLPQSCLPTKQYEDDFRMLTRARPKLDAKFVKVFVDEQRGLVIGVLPEHVVAAPLARLNLPIEKSVMIAKRMPARAYVGETVVVELETEADGVTFEVGDGRDSSGRDVVVRALGADGFDENLPRISNRTLTWTPSAEQAGPQRIHLRTRQGELALDWSWMVSVEQAKSGLPFYVTGVNINVDGDLAAVWGRSKSAAEGTHILGVFDVARRELIRQTEVSKPIYSATIDSSGVYACLDSQLVRLNRESLQVETETSSMLPADVQVVGGKYLAVRGRRGSFDRFTIPDLQPAEPAVNDYSYLPLGGRLGDQWLWDGVVWDSRMKMPELLAFPALFGVPPSRNDRGFIGGLPSLCAYQTPGRYAGVFNAKRPTYDSSCTPFGYNGFLYVQYGKLNAHRNIAHLNGVEPKSPENSITLVNGTGDSGYMACGKEQVAVACDGRLSWISIADVLPAHERFEIARKQSTMTLDFDKPTKIRYEAKDAVKYSLLLWTGRPDPDFYDEPQMKADSADGRFTIALDAKQVLDKAVQTVNAARFPGENHSTTGVLERYMAAVTAQFELLVGRKPTGVPYPVYAVVLAESSFGETNVLVHSYLVEVPRASFEGKLK